MIGNTEESSDLLSDFNDENQHADIQDSIYIYINYSLTNIKLTGRIKLSKFHYSE